MGAIFIYVNYGLFAIGVASSTALMQQPVVYFLGDNYATTVIV
jgi:hypothetical protein